MKQTSLSIDALREVVSELPDNGLAQIRQAAGGGELRRDRRHAVDSAPKR